MKITGRKSQPLAPMTPLAGPVNTDQAEAAQTPERVTDKVELASSTQVRKLAEAARALPAVRTEKVEELRGKIDDGSYHVDSEVLARKVVDEAINDLLARELKTGTGL